MTDRKSTATPDVYHDGDGKPVRLEPITYVHSTNFAELLASWRGSLVVSTYQAGRLMLVRSRGGRVSTLMRYFEHPMGIAARPGVMAVGTRREVVMLQNAPQIGVQIEPEKKYDACFVPRRSCYTGDIRIHELAWAGDELWFVNTRFSCLCTLSEDYCFVPRWWPKFITAIKPEDRCHLSGLAMHEGKPRYVTMHGQSDTPGGWRDHKREGGCIIDVTTGQVVIDGLSMPHSPRVRDGKLWFLDSGRGYLCFSDLKTAGVTRVTQLPGFVRGLCFAGDHALVAISKPRVGGVLDGAAISQAVGGPRCGVYVVSLISGIVEGLIEFQTGCDEIFDIQFVDGVMNPHMVGLGKDGLDQIYVMPQVGGDAGASQAGSVILPGDLPSEQS